MKKIILILLILMSLENIKAQAWQSKNFNLDIGYVLGSSNGAFYSPGLLISGEKGVHKWFGVGAYTGFQYNFAKYSKWDGSYSDPNITIPIGGSATFHFYQMLSDLIDEEIGTNRLDMAIKGGIGANICYSKNFYFGYNWGASLLARYYVSKNVGIYAEVGHSMLGIFIVGATIKF